MYPKGRSSLPQGRGGPPDAPEAPFQGPDPALWMTIQTRRAQL